MLHHYRGSFLYLFLLFIPVFIFGAYLFINAVNVPYDDDEALLYTINQIHHSPPPRDIFKILLVQHNDHRIFFSRLAGVIIDLLNGEMDFRIMILCGFFNLILLGYSFFLIFKSFSKNLLYFVPVFVLLFSPIVYATQLWSITAFEQTLAIAFSLYCLYFLQPEKYKIWYYSIPLAIAATLSNLDGLGVIPIALVWLMVQKRNKESWLFGAFTVIYLYLFFVDFRFSSSSQFPPFPQIIAIVIKGFISFTGSITKVISDTHVYLLSIISGGSMLLAYAVFTVMKFTKAGKLKNPVFSISFPEICFLKLLACGFMIALGRAGEATENMFADRFQIYSAGIFITFYLFVLANLENKNLSRAFSNLFFVSVLFLSFLSYNKYNSAVAFHNDELKADAYNCKNHSLYIHQYPRDPDPVAEFYKHYTFPDYFNTKLIPAWNKQMKSQKVTSPSRLKSRILDHAGEYELSRYPVISFEIANLPLVIPQENVFLLLIQSGKTEKPFLVAVRPASKQWFSWLSDKNVSANSFSVLFPDKIPDNLYDVALCWTANNVPKSLLIARKLRMPQ